jgi:CheY-like chemotaxis protein
MESGVRGYLLTGSDQFLDPYRKALVLYPGALGTLVRTASTPRTQRLAADIQKRIDSYAQGYLRPLLRLSHTDPQRARSVVETEEGKRRVDALRRQFLAVLDIMMPKLDGYEVTRTIRRNPALASLPVLLLTASVREVAATKGFEAGANEHMRKPFSPQELLVRVRSLLALAGPEPRVT